MINSHPLLVLNKWQDNIMADVPELHVTVSGISNCEQSNFSSSRTFGPEVIQPERRAESTSCSISGELYGGEKGICILLFSNYKANIFPVFGKDRRQNLI